jgi:hypothetical protein
MDAGGIHPGTANDNSPIGTNLTGLTDYSTEWAFVDAMKMSRQWISGSSSAWDDGRAVDVDSDGWVRSLAPGQVVRTLMFWDLAGAYPQGRYVVLYDGAGSMQYFGGASKDSSASSPGRDVLDVGVGGIGIAISAIDANNPLRNIRVILPGGVCSDDDRRACTADSGCASGATCQNFESVYETQVFHPQFLKMIERYSVLRFMDWGATNNSTQRVWTDRPKPSDARYTVKGAPVEVMVDLANRIGADAWFTIPHLADDNYVTSYARTVASRLAIGLKVYVEHSNEVWNGIFTQNSYGQSQGAALGLGGDTFETGLRYHSRRSVELFRIFERELGGLDRLVRVMGAQAANSWTATAALDFENAVAETDAVAIAPYFGGGLGTEAGRVTQMTADQILNEIESRWVPEAIAWVRNHAAAASARGVDLISYEGGQHLVGVYGAENDATLNALFDAVNRSSRMKSIYTTYLAGWRDAGGSLFTHFVNCSAYSKWGRWGALERLDQSRSTAPKFDALQSFIETTPRWW